MANQCEEKSDTVLLLDCIKFQHNNVDFVVQALQTISKSCSTKAETQNTLREIGGLTFIQNLWNVTPHLKIKNASMYCIADAIDKNVYNQKLTATNETFSRVHDVLSAPTTNHQTIHAALYLLASLVANNNTGKTLLRDSGCLEILLQLFQKLKPKRDILLAGLNDISTTTNDLWSVVTSVLCISVNNPQNDENQRICSMIFPQALALLQDSTNLNVQQSVSSFIGLTVANNVDNQVRVEKCNGLEVIMSSLHRAVNRSKQSDRYMELALSHVAAVDHIMADNKRNAEKCVKLGILPLLLHLLSENVDEYQKYSFTLAIGHCIELSVPNQINLVENGGIGSLLNELSCTKNEELLKTIKYILQICVKIDVKNTKNLSVRNKLDVEDEIALLKGWGAENDTVGNKLFRKFKNQIELMESEHEMSKLSDFSPVSWRKNSQRHTAKRRLSMDSSPEQHTVDLTIEQGLESLVSMVRSGESVKYKELIEKEKVTAGDIADKELSILKTDNTNMDSKQMQKRLKALEEKFEKHLDVKERALSDTVDRVSKEDQQQRQEITKDPGYRKLEKELEKERMLRKQLEQEALDTKAALKRQRREEQAAARRTQQLAEELKKQQLQQVKVDKQLEAKVEESIKEHERLVALKEQKEKDLRDIEIKIENLKSFAKESGVTLTTPRSTVSIHSALNTPNLRKYDDLSISPTTEQIEKNFIINKKTNSKDIIYNKTQFPATDPKIFTDASSDEETWGDLRRVNKFRDQLSKDDSVFVRPQTPRKKPQKKNRNRSERQSNKSRLVCRITPRKAKEYNKDWGLYDSYYRPVSNHVSKRKVSALEIGQGDSKVLTTKFDPITPIQSIESDFDEMLVKTAGGITPSERESVISAPVSKGSTFTVTPRRSITSLNTPVSVKRVKDTRTFTVTPRRRITSLNTPVSVKRVKDTLRTNSPSVIKVPKREIQCKRNLNLSYFGEKEGANVGESGMSSDDELNSVTIVTGPLSLDTSTDSNEETPEIEATFHKFEKKLNQKCPGCQPPVDVMGRILDSYTFSVAMETNPYTCSFHRYLRLKERQLIYEVKKPAEKKHILRRVLEENVRSNVNKTQDVYDFPSSGTPDTNEDLSPLLSPSFEEPIKPDSYPDGKSRRRRARIQYTKQEELNLIHGVQNMGKFWTQILNTYKFHESRTAADLMEKYKRMKHKRNRSPLRIDETKGMLVTMQEPYHRPARKTQQPFSMTEERRLRRGVQVYGNNWSLILHSFKFSKSRTAQDLREKWRCLHKIK